MKTNRLLLALVLLTIVMQAALLYQQHRKSTADAAAPSANEPVETPPVRQAQAGTSIDISAMPIQGKSEAKVVLVEFSDYQCPFCARHAQNVRPELERTYVDNGRIRYAFANNPLSFHENAKPFAVAAICAGKQGQYWQMHDRLFSGQPKTSADVLTLAQSLQLDPGAFKECRDHDAKVQDQISRDSQTARELQMDFTPGFAAGILRSDGRVEVQTLINGAQPLAVFTRVLDDLIAQKDRTGQQSDHP